MTINQLAWAVSPENSRVNRATRLVQELIKLGVISADQNYWFHGTSASVENHRRAFPVLPGVSIRNEGCTGVLSPVFLPGSSKNAHWVDLYDDWSLAPDIRFIYRMLARRGYDEIRRHKRFQRSTITVNSPYMARMLGIQQANIVPNGVDPELASYTHLGNSKVRLIILGHFFKGRTDFALLRRVAMLPVFDHIVIGGPGRDEKVLALLGELKEALGDKLDIQPWVSMEQLAGMVGEASVALIPNIVSDYTLSQDAMKAYMFTAMGIPFICPGPLLPPTIPRKHVFMAGHGDRIDQHLPAWLENTRPSREERSDFVDHNSWSERAKLIAELID